MNEHERIVLGTILKYPHEILRFQFIEDDFSNDIRPLWNTIHNLFLEGKLSAQSVVSQLEASKITVSDGERQNSELVHTLMGYADKNAFDISATALIEATTKRRIQEIALSLNAEAKNGRSSVKIISDAIDLLQSLRRGKTEGKLIGELLPGFQEKMLKIRQGEKIEGWEPKLDAIRRITGPAAQSDFIIVAGYSGYGKSSLLRFEAIRAAMEGEVVVTFNGENDPEWYLRYGIAYISHTTEGLKLSTNTLKHPEKMSEAQWERFNECLEKLRELPWIIESIKPVEEMIFDVMRYRYRFGKVNLVQVDQIQNMGDTSFESIESSSYALRKMAMDLNTPVMAAHQLRKKEKGDTTSNPDQDDLLYAGTHAAKQIWIVYERNTSQTEAGYFRENRDPRTNLVLPQENWMVKITRVKIAKNSSGPTGVTGDIAWYRGYNDFQELEIGWNGKAGNATPVLSQRPIRPAPKPGKEDED